MLNEGMILFALNDMDEKERLTAGEDPLRR